MKNKKAIFAGTLIPLALALTGGVAYASTTGSPAPARPAVTTTVYPHGQATAQVRHDRCDRRNGGDRCDWRGHAYQRQVTQRQVTQHHGYRHRSHRTTYGYQGYGQYSGRSYQGSWGYQGSGQDGGHGYQGPHGGGGHHGSGGCW
jgi:hypothetical protein